ncbi:MAG: MotA/TolQ/ExbB proton channel family protein, partial [Candidatus Omnitrophica bacterium]|nr:MotA/TolQ/ExbB proton channel family protein [Candidatus Omnitrophota bacterium]
MWDLIQKGGPVMYLIIILSIIAFGIVIERIYNFNKARIDSQKFMDKILD